MASLPESVTVWRKGREDKIRRKVSPSLPGVKRDPKRTYIFREFLIAFGGRHARAFRAHLFELLASFPNVAPSSVVSRIADCVVGDRLAVVAGQLVLLVCSHRRRKEPS